MWGVGGAGAHPTKHPRPCSSLFLFDLGTVPPPPRSVRLYQLLDKKNHPNGEQGKKKKRVGGGGGAINGHYGIIMCTHIGSQNVYRTVYMYVCFELLLPDYVL